jgi:hypothetical protein
MTSGSRILDRLAHDVGKYVARAARNIPAEPAAMPAILLELLIKDLYCLDGKVRASAVFDRIANDLVSAPAEVALARARLVDIDALEDSVRSGEPAAIAHVSRLAREVEELLRAAKTQGA